MTIRNHPIEAEELMAYLDGELASEQANAAADHLETCMECQHLAADLRGVSQTLNTWALEPTNSAMPESLAAAMTERMPEPQPELALVKPWYRRRSFRSWAPALGACVAAAVVVVAVSLIGRNSNGVYSQVASATAGDKPLPPPSAGPVAAKSAPMSSQRSIGAGTDRDHLAKRTEKLLADSAPQPAESQSQEYGFMLAQVGRGSGSGTAAPTADLLPTSPMIIRTAELSLTTREFDKGRAQVEDILKRHRGYVATLNVTGAAGAGRTLAASLRIPSAQLDAALTELKALGRLVSESKNGQEVTAQYVDLQARLTNSRNTEKRLIDLLQNRTGKLSDVLEVENELARVRGEIESMEAERKNLSNQVDVATVNLTLTEDYRAQLQVVPPSTSTRLINAAVEGYRSMVDGLMSVVLFFLASGPTLLLWAAIVFFPVRFTWKRVRRNLSGASS
jgi:anti-sigma factor RsiW